MLLDDRNKMIQALVDTVDDMSHSELLHYVKKQKLDDLSALEPQELEAEYLQLFTESS